MSRIAKAPIAIENGIEVNVNGQTVEVKGSKGTLSIEVHDFVSVTVEDNKLIFAPKDASNKYGWAMAGTMRSLVSNLVIGVSTGWSKTLTLIGVGYRAAMKGKVLDLNLGFSHPVEFQIPEGIEIAVPSNTEIIVSGSNKQLVGQVAADIRSYRPPEPYKGKGIRYKDEYVVRKEAKKK